MILYKKDSNLYLYYIEDEKSYIVKMNTQEQFDWFTNRAVSVFYGMLDKNPDAPSDENILKQMSKLWDESDKIEVNGKSEVEANGYINISDVQKQGAVEAMNAMKATIERTAKIESTSNGMVMIELFTYLKNCASAYNRDSGTQKYADLIFACNFLTGDVTSEAYQTLNLLRGFSQYPVFTDATAVKSAPCGCSGSSLGTFGLMNAMSGVCDINSMWKMWMLNIVFWYMTNAEFWLDIKAYDSNFDTLASILTKLHLKDYIGCSCKDLTNSYSITSADLMRFLDLLRQLGDCPTNVTFMWRTLAIMIFTQLFNIIYIQNQFYV